MMRIRNAVLISDLHLGSDKIAQFRGYDDAWDFWIKYQEIHNKQITYDDQPVFILGDIAISKDWLNILSGQLRGKLHLVLGNHDVEEMSVYSRIVRRSKGTANALVMLPHQKVVLSHIPVHPCFFDGKPEWINLHGHLHTQNINSKHYFNVSFDQAQQYNSSQLFNLSDFYQ